MSRLVAAFLVVLVVLAGCAPAGEDRSLPDASLELLEGGSYELRQTGQPRALNLWATWCAPCLAELPAFDGVAGRVEGIDILGINTGDSSEDAGQLVDELGLSFTQVLDPLATLQAAMRITGMPATIFVDADGDVVQVHNGELTTEELEELLVELFDATFSA